MYVNDDLRRTTYSSIIKTRVRLADAADIVDLMLWSPFGKEMFTQLTVCSLCDTKFCYFDGFIH